VTIRRLAWIVFVASLVLPALWARAQLLEFDRSHPQFACGLPIMAIYGLAMIGSGVLSLVAAALGAKALAAAPRPIAARRKLEFAMLAMPALLACGLVGSVLLFG
jgi:hypothetical protein